MASVTQSTGVVNPQYEIGVNVPVNQGKNNKPKQRINLPIPPNVIFFREFKAGETLPIHFRASGNLVEVDSSPQTLKFMRDIFVRATKTSVAFSTDQQNWRPFSQLFRGDFDLRIEQNDSDSTPHAVAELHAYVI